MNPRYRIRAARPEDFAAVIAIEHAAATRFREVGIVLPDDDSTVADLEEASHLLVGPLIAEHEGRFVEMVTKAIRASALPAAYKRAGLDARKLADTLYATARGLKHGCPTRADFGERFGFALRALCMPLAEKNR